MTEQMKLRGTLEGHNDWVTQIATTNEVPDMILSSSRGTFCCAPWSLVLTSFFKRGKERLNAARCLWVCAATC